MNLSLRLTEVKKTVINCDTACDVGCDHGFIAIELVREGKAQKVIACDINKGPLEAAAKNISLAGFNDRIETRLSNGFEKIRAEDNINAVVIAGMGGSLMSKILEEGKGVSQSVEQFVLQPQSEIFLVRKWLRDNGYNIVQEKIVLDMGKYYFIIDARPGVSPIYEEKIQYLYDNFSGYLIEHKDPMLRQYLEKGLAADKGYLEGIESSKQVELLKKISDIETALSMMEP